MLRRTLAIIVMLCVATLLYAAGCGKQPAPKIEQQQQQPTREEPTISLYDNDTGQKKMIKIEEYVQGVVAAEMDVKWPVNALAAQAVLARTFTMENIKSGRVKELHGADVSTSIEESQAYEPSKINDNVRQAVAATRGEVVTYNGSYIHAWFSACDGGISATAEEGLAYNKEPTPYIKGGVQDGCLEITEPKNKEWQAKIPVGQVQAAVQGKTSQNTGAVTTASIEKKGPSGRAEQIKVGGATISGPALRLALGSEKVRSTLLTGISVSGGQLVLTGKGFGHGVGMCQWGARLMAEQGKTPEEIINFYFQDVSIQKEWN